MIETMKRVYVYLVTAMLTLVMTASQCGCGIDEPDYYQFDNGNGLMVWLMVCPTKAPVYIMTSINEKLTVEQALKAGMGECRFEKESHGYGESIKYQFVLSKKILHKGDKLYVYLFREEGMKRALEREGRDCNFEDVVVTKNGCLQRKDALSGTVYFEYESMVVPLPKE